jgi:hypothetical protein
VEFPVAVSAKRFPACRKNDERQVGDEHDGVELWVNLEIVMSHFRRNARKIVLAIAGEQHAILAAVAAVRFHLEGLEGSFRANLALAPVDEGDDLHGSFLVKKDEAHEQPDSTAGEPIRVTHNQGPKAQGGLVGCGNFSHAILPPCVAGTAAGLLSEFQTARFPIPGETMEKFPGVSRGNDPETIPAR